jgi:hypothetical protein
MTTTTAQRVSQESPKASTGTASRRAVAVSVASGAVGTMRTTAEEAASRLPDVAAKGKSALDDANRRIEQSTDEMVRLGTVLSFGFAAGLLVGGAPRILVGAAMVPAAMLGLAVLDRTANRAASAKDAATRL